MAVQNHGGLTQGSRWEAPWCVRGSFRYLGSPLVEITHRELPLAILAASCYQY